jgi:hypothetical protein
MPKSIFFTLVLFFSFHSLFGMEVDNKQKISFAEDLAERTIKLLNRILDNDTKTLYNTISSAEKSSLEKRCETLKILKDEINKSSFTVFNVLVSIKSEDFPKEVCQHRNYKEKDKELVSALLALYSEITPLKELSKSYAKKTATALDHLNDGLCYNPILASAIFDHIQQWQYHISNPTNTFLILAEFNAFSELYPIFNNENTSHNIHDEINNFPQACTALKTFYNEIIETHQRNGKPKQELMHSQSDQSYDYLVSLGCDALAELVEKNRSSKAL